jgi:hypothetical protein
MRISVRVHGNLKYTSSVGTDEQEFYTTPGTCVRDLLGELNIWETEIRRVLRNGQVARLNTPLRARDLLEFFA